MILMTPQMTCNTTHPQPSRLNLRVIRKLLVVIPLVAYIANTEYRIGQQDSVYIDPFTTIVHPYTSQDKNNVYYGFY